jgi:zinc transporter
MSDVKSEHGLIRAYVLDGKGGGTPAGWPEIRAHKPGDAPIWVHLERDSEHVRKFIAGHASVDPSLSRMLTDNDVRPRVTRVGNRLLMVLRGINFNEGDDLEDMVSLRIWAGPGLIVTLRRRPVRVVMEMEEGLKKGTGPCNEGEFLVQLIDGLLDHVALVVDAVENQIDTLEDEVLVGTMAECRGRLSDIRRRAITLRRYLAPQRDAMLHLMGQNLDWLSDLNQSHLREFADRTIHTVEDLDAVRERAAVIHEEIATRLAERMNRTMYVLTIVATILLPAGLIAGLMGMNVAVPGTDFTWSFVVVVGLMVVLAGAELAVLRWMRLI